MTQLYDEFPSRTDPGRKELRDLDPDEPLPTQLEKPLAALANVLGLGSVDEARNLIAMMVANPQLQYVLFLWQVLGTRVEGGIEEDDDENEEARAAAEAPAAAGVTRPGSDQTRIKGQPQDPVTGQGKGQGRVEVELQVQENSRGHGQTKEQRHEKDAAEGIVHPAHPLARVQHVSPVIPRVNAP